ncbi:MAG: phytanoyl-CoA dioxygenase family protein [Ilumatobacteraceae bacterium]|mgnify:FL=1|jgi:phytanoyl-CoA hydroxylase|nr:phytanoyl-CoA dioxygenase family protein [Ilumatobacteraceae bacterium]MDP4705237.1 phytanoyl-CoA dioxygenase family protein [Ilumatobacteraceae bacterium]MDP4713502.1 phytanoyl-CoA dioxygenase family protein [Ilumatobacteraceae bacterium]MDP5115031.1 phytanoyl-CoA dioxygenase family protein [Ilumatobacteraceae bacterium]
MGAFLTDQQIADYHRDGFLVLPDFAKPSACVALKAQAEKILHNFDPDANRSVFTTNEQSRHADQQFIDSATGIICFFEEEAFDDTGTLKQSKELSINKIGHAMHDLDPVFESFTYTPELAAVASDLGMPDALALQTMYICKQPRIGGEVSCHQDATFLYSDPITVTGFWFAIEDATLENGCLWAAPGGHKTTLRKKFVRNEANDGATFEVLDDSPLPAAPTELVPLEVKAGTLVVLHGLLPHWSDVNRSEKSRHAYSLHCISESAEYPEWNWLQRNSELPLRRLDKVAVSL